MPGLINEYFGPGFVEGNSTPHKKTEQQAIRETYRAVMRAHAHNGRIALNAYDFSRTAHLPVGRGRLACDPDSGDFDKDAPRPSYIAGAHSKYPFIIHSVVTDGEYREVRNKDEHDRALQSGMWSDKPIERKRRFVLTEADQMALITSELNALKYRNLQLESKLANPAAAAPVGQPDNFELTQALEKANQRNSDLESRVALLFDQFEKMQNAYSAALASSPTPVAEVTEKVDDPFGEDEEEVERPKGKSRR